MTAQKRRDGESDESPVLASDGLPARLNGPWAKDKLSFIDEFGPPALQATVGKLQRYYVDLFAGPGMNVDPENRRHEFEGSALRALRLCAVREERTAFTHAFLVNRDIVEHEALASRIASRSADGQCRVPAGHIHLLNDDANRVLSHIMGDSDLKAYVFLFADIEQPSQWPWRTVEAIKAQGHKSVDLYLLFPLGMAINRLISYTEEMTTRNENALDTFFGHEGWKDLARARITDRDSPELRRSLTELYLDGLRRHWHHAIVVRQIYRVGRHQLYQMLFASDHRAGASIAEWARGKEDTRNQLGFDFRD